MYHCLSAIIRGNNVLLYSLSCCIRSLVLPARLCSDDGFCGAVACIPFLLALVRTTNNVEVALVTPNKFCYIGAIRLGSSKTRTRTDFFPVHVQGPKGPIRAIRLKKAGRLCSGSVYSTTFSSSRSATDSSSSTSEVELEEGTWVFNSLCVD
jgi:hypothetical protein